MKVITRGGWSVSCSVVEGVGTEIKSHDSWTVDGSRLSELPCRVPTSAH
jgi:hypothetical protein